MTEGFERIDKGRSWKVFRPRLLLAGARATERKFRSPTAVSTTNPRNKYPNVKPFSWAIN